MIKRKQSNPGAGKGPVTASMDRAKSTMNKHPRGDDLTDKKPLAWRKPGQHQDQVLREQYPRQYLNKSVLPGHGNDPELLKYYLSQNFASPANLAREANVSRAAVSAVIHGRTRSERIERMIAKTCGRSLQDIFPAWYQGSK